MSMMDLQSALGGQGEPPPGPAPGLAGALGGGPMLPPDQGQPIDEAEPPGAPETDTEGSSLDHLLAAEDSLQQFISVDPDDADRAKASQALKIILDLKAANTQDAREGGMKSLSRALGGGGGGLGG